MSRAVLWLEAFAIVLTGAAAGAAVGQAAGGHPYLGAASGTAFGMAVNYKRKCPVCMEHLEAAQSLLSKA